MDELRQQINECDDQIMQLLDHRFQIVRKVAQYKQDHQLPIRQNKRMDELVQRLSSQYSGENISKQFVQQLYQIIMEHAIELEEKEIGHED
ncbi:chorismate mutase-like protein [Paucilactobacillus hokkaidonensis JCM 18461]|uniref:Chorismate mutase-like protein n=2 Tax=Paucilactobacillus hokkaidonensis TaxID=1193095 RepID=A0A0A1GZU1_9LACO|nr:chorismate mutase [Paucilactobacillus hokkaidonensis]KRO11122.1 hypothetical protein IV59_GL000874 [Paucilactobacillus hokkaidonensis]BAP86514.1 chorismate mutase-like protein [Paucilactobacillus hokkaidonensis JCM 18461]